MTPQRPCLDCGVLTRNPGSRCRPHELAYQRARNTQPHRAQYGGKYQKFRQQALEQATHCTKCGTALVRSKTSPQGATYDHATDSIQCRSCNSAGRRNP